MSRTDTPLETPTAKARAGNRARCGICDRAVQRETPEADWVHVTCGPVLDHEPFIVIITGRYES